MVTFEELASYRRCADRIDANWQAFQERRAARLRERERFGHAAERAVESIVEDLFTMVLDWSFGDINHQVGYADILLTRLGIKHLIVETKRPGSLAWNRLAVDRALEQVCRYAAEQKVRCVAVSDGTMIYAADVCHGGLSDRIFCSIADPEPQAALCWLSLDGIYRERSDAAAAKRDMLPEVTPVSEAVPAELADERLLHPKYKLPVQCFAYAGDASDPRTWRLPYLNDDGSVDAKRLPKGGAVDSQQLSRRSPEQRPRGGYPRGARAPCMCRRQDRQAPQPDRPAGLCLREPRCRDRAAWQVGRGELRRLLAAWGVSSKAAEVEELVEAAEAGG